VQAKPVLLASLVMAPASLLVFLTSKHFESPSKSALKQMAFEYFFIQL